MPCYPGSGHGFQPIAANRTLLLTLDIGILGGEGSHTEADSMAFVSGAILPHPAEVADPMAPSDLERLMDPYAGRLLVGCMMSRREA